MTDAGDHLRLAVRKDNGPYTWDKPVGLKKPRGGGAVHPAGIAPLSADAFWVTSTRSELGEALKSYRVPAGPAARLAARPAPAPRVRRHLRRLA